MHLYTLTFTPATKSASRSLCMLSLNILLSLWQVCVHVCVCVCDQRLGLGGPQHNTHTSTRTHTQTHTLTCKRTRNTRTRTHTDNTHALLQITHTQTYTHSLATHTHTQTHKHTYVHAHTPSLQLDPVRQDAMNPHLLTSMYRAASRQAGAHPRNYDMMQALAGSLLQEVCDLDMCTHTHKHTHTHTQTHTHTHTRTQHPTSSRASRLTICTCCASSCVAKRWLFSKSSSQCWLPNPRPPQPTLLFMLPRSVADPLFILLCLLSKPSRLCLCMLLRLLSIPDALWSMEPGTGERDSPCTAWCVCVCACVCVNVCVRAFMHA